MKKLLSILLLCFCFSATAQYDNGIVEFEDLDFLPTTTDNNMEITFQLDLENYVGGYIQGFSHGNPVGQSFVISPDGNQISVMGQDNLCACDLPFSGDLIDIFIFFNNSIFKIEALNPLYYQPNMFVEIGVYYGSNSWMISIPEEEISINEYLLGCIDSTACNYSTYATYSDNSCEYSDVFYDCDGNCNTDENGECLYLGVVYDSIQNDFINSLSSMQQALDTWNTTIDLSEGWNMFGYGCPSSIGVAEGLSNHTDIIVITKDNNGNVYMPEFGFNGIGDFTPGFGYQIKLTEAIEGFSLCDWYVNDIPEDNIVSLQEEATTLQEEVDFMSPYFGCIDETACNYDTTAILDNGSCNYPEPGFDCNGNQLEIGGFYGGGIIFYIDETAQHGLIAAIEDITEGSNMGFWGISEGFEWGCLGENVSGADGQAIGTGYQNTLDIFAQNCQTENGGITAAQVTLNYETKGYTDWYLPSLEELYEMYNTIGNGSLEGNIGGFEMSDYPYYWSSSEHNSTQARGVYFNDGGSNGNGKTDSFRVRPIRSF
tara:strand:- start:98 stop:1723 length:1626 start_codon:yes stop_codon:yes gene_type:complete